MPITLSFFDVVGDHGLTFASPLFDITGFSIELIHLDVMHVLDLGVSQYLAGAVLRELVENNFCRSTAAYAEMRRFDCIKALRKHLASFYKEDVPERSTRSRIGRLTLPMLGTQRAKPRLHSKAAECRHLIPLLVKLCDDYSVFLGERGAYLRVCCKSMHDFYQTMAAEKRDMSEPGLQRLQNSMVRFLINWKAYAGHLVYKHHCFWHLAERARRHGNPRYYWTYADEGENRVMGTVAKRLHGSMNFYLSFLQRVLPERA